MTDSKSTDKTGNEDSPVAEKIPGDEGYVTDGRPATQVEAERGARDGIEPPDPALRAQDRARADAYAKDGIRGAPGSEVPRTDSPAEQPEGVRPESQVLAEAPVRGDGDRGDAGSDSDENAGHGKK